MSCDCSTVSIWSDHLHYLVSKAHSYKQGLTWEPRKEQMGLCNNVLEEREDEKQELVNQGIQLSFEL